MCEVCIAEALISGFTSKTESIYNKAHYELRGASEDGETEMGPCVYQICRNGVWSAEFTSERNCLADIVAFGGFDTKATHRSERMDKFLDKHFEDNNDKVVTNEVTSYKIVEAKKKEKKEKKKTKNKLEKPEKKIKKNHPIVKETEEIPILIPEEDSLTKEIKTKNSKHKQSKKSKKNGK